MFGDAGRLASTEMVKSELQYRGDRIRDELRGRRRGLVRNPRRRRDVHDPTEW